MGGDTIRNMLNSFPEINELCNVASRKHIKRNILTVHGPLNVKLVDVTPNLQFRAKRNRLE